MGMYGRFTERAQKAIMLSQEEAKRMKHNYVGTEHLLLGLIAEKDGVAAVSLKEMGVDLDNARKEVEKLIGFGNEEDQLVGFTPRTKRIFELSFLQARNLGHNYVGTEHLLLGLIAEGEGVAMVVLKNLGVDVKQLGEKVVGMITSDSVNKGTQPGTSGAESPSQSSLGKYTIDLNKMAEDGRIDPVIGRSKEIERVIQILSRRTKNNPVLIGEPGVGKTAIAEGLAQRIYEIGRAHV